MYGPGPRFLWRLGLFLLLFAMLWFLLGGIFPGTVLFVSPVALILGFGALLVANELTRGVGNPRTIPVIVVGTIAVAAVYVGLVAYVVSQPVCGPVGDEAANPSVELILGPATPSTSPDRPTSYDNVSVRVSNPAAAGCPSPSLTTSLFGLKINNGTNTPILPAASPTACAVGAASIAACIAATHGSTAWYAVLTGSAGSVLATYPTTAGSTSWNGGTVSVASSDTLVIISGAPLSGSGDTLSVFGTFSSVVTGSTTL